MKVAGLVLCIAPLLVFVGGVAVLGATAGQSPSVGHPYLAGEAYALPLDRAVFEAHPTWISAPHHCCTPAIDIPVPVGTPTFASTAGYAVRIDQPGGCGWGYQVNGDDGTAYVYCHLSQLDLPSGARVTAGDQLGLTGGARGAPGAGNSTGAHLHFGVRRGGVDWCPQPALQAWFGAQPTDPAAVATRDGCTA